jgi:hypothetical protein
VISLDALFRPAKDISLNHVRILSSDPMTGPSALQGPPTPLLPYVVFATVARIRWSSTSTLELK